MNQKTRLVEIAQNLHRLEVLLEPDYQEVVHEIEQGQIWNRARLLQLMQEQALHRLIPEISIGTIGQVQIGIVGDLDKERIEQLKQLVQRLKASGVISDRVYRKLQRKVGTTLQVELLVFGLASELMATDLEN